MPTEFTGPNRALANGSKASRGKASHRKAGKKRAAAQKHTLKRGQTKKQTPKNRSGRRELQKLDNQLDAYLAHKHRRPHRHHHRQSNCSRGELQKLDQQLDSFLRGVRADIIIGTIAARLWSSACWTARSTTPSPRRRPPGRTPAQREGSSRSPRPKNKSSVAPETSSS